MSALLVASLVANVLVLLPVTGSLLLDASWVADAFGPRQPGRQILLAIYLSILGVSAVLLFWQNVDAALGLLLAQIAYKVLSPLTVGTLRNPVVLSNLAIAALHGVTVASLL